MTAYETLLESMANGIVEATKQYAVEQGDGNATLSAVMFCADLAVDVIRRVVPTTMSDLEIEALAGLFLDRVGHKLSQPAAEQRIRDAVRVQ